MVHIGNFSSMTFSSIGGLTQLSSSTGIGFAPGSVAAITSGFELAGTPSMLPAFWGLPEAPLPRPPFSPLSHHQAFMALNNFMSDIAPFAGPGSAGFLHYMALQDMYNTMGQHMANMGAAKMSAIKATAGDLAGTSATMNGFSYSSSSFNAVAGAGMSVSVTTVTATVEVAQPKPPPPPPPPPKPKPPPPPPRPPQPVLRGGDGDGDGDGDPLVFDLDKNGIKLDNRDGRDPKVKFDLDGDGTKDTIDNVNEGVLAIRGGESGKDLFGNYTDLDNDGKADGYKDGFSALRGLAEKEGLIDGEKDMVLDATDLGKLQDKYGLGIKQGYDGKMQSLKEAGITEINLSNANANQRTALDGDTDIQTQEGATFKMKDGSSSTYADVWHKGFK